MVSKRSLLFLWCGGGDLVDHFFHCGSRRSCTGSLIFSGLDHEKVQDEEQCHNVEAHDRNYIPWYIHMGRHIRVTIVDEGQRL